MIAKQWYKKRCYLHFDSPISLLKAQKIVKRSKIISQWGFLPFLHTVIHSQKISSEKVIKRKERNIHYAGHIDSHIYSYYSKILEEKYEALLRTNNLTETITAFRKLNDIGGKGQCNIHFAKKAFDDIQSMSPCVVLCFDISGFFDNIDHAILKKMWEIILDTQYLPSDHYNVFKSITRYSFVDRDSVYNRFGISRKNRRNKHRICEINEFRDIVRREKYIKNNENKYGIPQGSPISGVLSNIYLFQFDVELKRIADKFGAVFYRYCDDIILICKNNDELFFKNIFMSHLHAVKLKANHDKTAVSIFEKRYDCFCSDKPVQYLGFMYDGQRVYIRSSSYIKFMNRMKKAVSLARQTATKYNKIRFKNNLIERKIFKRKLYSKYSHLGRRNFITYALRAARIMNEMTIRKQIKPLWKKLIAKINKAEESIYINKSC